MSGLQHQIADAAVTGGNQAGDEVVLAAKVIGQDGRRAAVVIAIRQTMGVPPLGEGSETFWWYSAT